MRPVGLTSVTFRQLSVGEIIALARETGCTGIEWGSDVHIKPKQLDQAGQAAEGAFFRYSKRIYMKSLLTLRSV